MNFVCIVFELGDKMLTLSSMENLIVQCNLQAVSKILTIPNLFINTEYSGKGHRSRGFD